MLTRKRKESFMYVDPSNYFSVNEVELNDCN